MLISPESSSPFRPGAEPPIYSPFSPLLFRDEFQQRPWFAFKDWLPRDDFIHALFASVMGRTTFRTPFPAREPFVISRLPDERSAALMVWLRNDVNFDGYIDWDEQGRVFANYFSDFMMTNLSPAEAVTVFGRTLAQMWVETCEDFNPAHYTDETDRAVIGAFVDDLKRTWGGRRLRDHAGG